MGNLVPLHVFGIKAGGPDIVFRCHDDDALIAIWDAATQDNVVNIDLWVCAPRPY
jgi:hypothetical protein